MPTDEACPHSAELPITAFPMANGFNPIAIGISQERAGLLRLMAYNHPPVRHTVAILAAMVLVLFVIWGPS